MKVQIKMLQRLGLMVTGIVLYIIFQKCFAIGCPMRYFWHIPCAGCGMTRAFECLRTGDFKMAFYYHPLYILVPFMGLMIVVGDVFSQKVRLRFWVSIGIAFGTVYIIRLFLKVPVLFG